MWQKIKDTVAAVARNPRAAAKSALQTLAGVGAALALIPGFVDQVSDVTGWNVAVSIPVEVTAWIAGASAVLRTLLVALNPWDDSYGLDESFTPRAIRARRKAAA